MTRQQYDVMRGPEGSLVLGDVETVAAKILRMKKALGIQRFMLHISVGTLPHDRVMNAIRLLGEQVGRIVNED